MSEFDGGNHEALDKYKLGIKTIPIPTYIHGPNSKSQEEIYEKLNINETNNECCISVREASLGW